LDHHPNSWGSDKKYIKIMFQTFQTTNQLMILDSEMTSRRSVAWLVVSTKTPLKNDGVNVSWDDDIPN
jgi:hypothetical protein